MKRAAVPAKTPKLAARVPLIPTVSTQMMAMARLWLKPIPRSIEDLRLDGGGNGEARNPTGDGVPAAARLSLAWQSKHIVAAIHHPYEAEPARSLTPGAIHYTPGAQRPSQGRP